MIEFSGVLAQPVKLLVASAVLAITGLSERSDAQVSNGETCSVPSSAAELVADSDAGWSFDAWFAGGTHEPIKTRVGHKEDRALYLLGVSISRPLERWRLGDLRFTPTFVPGILATANREYKVVNLEDSGSVTLPEGTESIPYKKSAFGVGLIPLAVEGSLHITRRAGIVIGGGGGVAYFDRRIPDPGETRFNFLADGHTGVYLRSGIGVTTVGFRLQHISNGGTGRVNPGLDSRMLYVGFAR